MRLDLIQQRVRSLGIGQKEVAGRVYEHLTGESRAFSTVETKFNKLLAGSDEGRNAFTKPPLRGALAAALGIAESELAEWFAGDAILLDPRFSPDLIAVLRRQVADSNIELIEVSTTDGTPREALRAAADRREDAIIALASNDDVAFYEGRGRRFSLLEHRPRFGAILANFPDLVPALPPEPPTVWDEREGKASPRVVRRDLELAIELGDLEVADGRVLDALKSQLAIQRSNNQVPSFPLGDVQAWLERKSGTTFTFLAGTSWRKEPRHGLMRIEGDPAAEEATDLWIHERRLYVRGSGSAQLGPWLNPHQPIAADPAINGFREALRTRNPFSDERFEQLVTSGRSVGLDLTPWLQKHLTILRAEPADTTVLAWSAAQESSARAILRGLCAREWQIPRSGPGHPSYEKGAPATVSLWLRRAVDAPVALLAPGVHDLHLLASLGAGRVLRIRLSRFPDSSPTRLTVDKQLEVEGGDVHLWLHREYDEMLEGDSLVPRRRKDAAERAEVDDYDDD